MRTAIIGDVGGHATQLKEALWALGADPDTGFIPQDLTIIQLGDLIHRGPDSSGVIQMVDKFYHTCPTAWIQLMGNHEANYLKTPSFKWAERLDPASTKTLKSWHASGWLKLAHSFTSLGLPIRRSGGDTEMIAQGVTLITHAGLTAGLWEKLGSPDNTEVADAINLEGANTPPEKWGGVFSPGAMLGLPENLSAGVLWAQCTAELYKSWILHLKNLKPTPQLNQVHGHSIPFGWNGGSWQDPLPHYLVSKEFPKVTGKALRDPRHTIIEIDTNTFFGTDPGHGNHPINKWAPLILES